MKNFLTLLTFFFLTASAWANTDSRVWTFSDGTSIKADFMSYDKASNIIKLKPNGQEVIDVQLAELSPLDQAWLKQFNEMQNEMSGLLNKVGGQYEQAQTIGETLTDYYIYYPSTYKDNNNLPLLLLFHPGGQGSRFLKRHILAAEMANIIIVCPDHIRNNDKGIPELEVEFSARFNDLYATLKSNIIFDTTQFYMGGSSGGALRAYHYSAEFAQDCKGVFANGGWLGYKYDYNYPAMRVAVVNGHIDRAANNFVEPDGKVLKAKGSTIKLFAFEGGHQVAPVDTMTKSFLWLVEKEKYYAGFVDDLEAIRESDFLEIENKKISAKEAFTAMEKILSKIDFSSMNREKILTLLGDPETLNSFSEKSSKEDDAPLTYILHDGNQGMKYTFRFENSTCVEVIETEI